jgi:hypothetical protein
MDAVLSFVSAPPIFTVGASLDLVVVIYTYILVALSPWINTVRGG